MPDKKNNHYLIYALRQADNCLVLGHRLSEWCGHGPVLEQDIALTNIALDLVGQSRLWYASAIDIEGKNNTEDYFAYHRDVRHWKNCIITETPNGNWGFSIMRQYLFSAWYYFNLEALSTSKYKPWRDIAKKAIKEVTYHLRWSSEWVVRLGDGTEKSQQKMQDAVAELWPYTGELFEEDETEKLLIREKIITQPSHIIKNWEKHVKATLQEATLKMPDSQWMQTGGRVGKHSEHLGYVLAELQYLPNTFPDAKW